MSQSSYSPVVLITGCSSGFGLLTAARLAAKGYTVVATMRDLKKEGNLTSEVNRRGGAVEVLQMDVTDKQSVARAVKEIRESLRYELQFFGINVLLIEPGTYKTKIFYENAQYARHFDNPDSPYFVWSQHLRKKVLAYVNDCHKDPEEIGAMVEKLIRAKNPPFRNIPDIESQVLSWLRRVLPFRVYSAMIRMFFMEGFGRSRLGEADHNPMRPERNSSMPAQ